jgi:hypothetical protein
MKRKIGIVLLILVPVVAISLTNYVFNMQEPYPEGDLSYLNGTRHTSRASKAPPIETLKYLYVYEYVDLHEFDILVDFSEGTLYEDANYWSFELKRMEPGRPLTAEAASKLRELVEGQRVWDWKSSYAIKHGMAISHCTVSLECEDGSVKVHKGEESNKPDNFEFHQWAICCCRVSLSQRAQRSDQNPLHARTRLGY